MPQGDDFVTDAPALPVDPDPAAAPPADADPATSAPVDPTPEAPAPPDETAAQARRDRAFAAQRRTIDAQSARIAALEARVLPAPATTPPPVAPAAGDAAPAPDAYPDHASYVQAVAQWAVVQGERTREATAQQTAFRPPGPRRKPPPNRRMTIMTRAAADTTRYHPAVLHALQTSGWALRWPTTSPRTRRTPRALARWPGCRPARPGTAEARPRRPWRCRSRLTLTLANAQTLALAPVGGSASGSTVSPTSFPTTSMWPG
jgi:hypothetical protein